MEMKAIFFLGSKILNLSLLGVTNIEVGSEDLDCEYVDGWRGGMCALGVCSLGVDGEKCRSRGARGGVYIDTGTLL